jgi:hypothetical protein
MTTWRSLKLKLSVVDSRYNFLKNLSPRENGPLGFVKCKKQLAKLIDSVKKDLRTRIQLAILKADTMLEATRLGIINYTNYNTNALQHRLFLASMWIDQRFDN